MFFKLDRVLISVFLLFFCSNLAVSSAEECLPEYDLPGSAPLKSKTPTTCISPAQCECVDGKIKGQRFRACDCQDTLDAVLTTYFDGVYDTALNLSDTCSTNKCTTTNDLAIGCTTCKSNCQNVCGSASSVSTAALIGGLLSLLAAALLH
uniref:Uncharacterized protein n=1 Tax=Panagrellus redivivus TaxID=6233 RepID=A0A7E5A1L2_PANRE